MPSVNPPLALVTLKWSQPRPVPGKQVLGFFYIVKSHDCTLLRQPRFHCIRLKTDLQLSISGGLQTRNACSIPVCVMTHANFSVIMLSDTSRLHKTGIVCLTFRTADIENWGCVPSVQNTLLTSILQNFKLLILGTSAFLNNLIWEMDNRGGIKKRE